VPQESVLGPLLFLAFINDIADGMTGLGRLFADDTSIGHIANDKDSLQVRSVRTVINILHFFKPINCIYMYHMKTGIFLTD
jgi:hypothetical protein